MSPLQQGKDLEGCADCDEGGGAVGLRRVTRRSRSAGAGSEQRNLRTTGRRRAEGGKERATGRSGRENVTKDAATRTINRYEIENSNLHSKPPPPPTSSHHLLKAGPSSALSSLSPLSPLPPLPPLPAPPPATTTSSSPHRLVVCLRHEPRCAADVARNVCTARTPAPHESSEGAQERAPKGHSGFNEGQESRSMSTSEHHVCALGGRSHSRKHLGKLHIASGEREG